MSELIEEMDEFDLDTAGIRHRDVPRPDTEV